MKALKTSQELPKARRRHTSCFVGSCLLIFGGFNGEYFNDLHYINVFDLKAKLTVPKSHKSSLYVKFLNNYHLSDHKIETLNGDSFPVHRGILAHSFNST